MSQAAGLPTTQPHQSVALGRPTLGLRHVSRWLGHRRALHDVSLELCAGAGLFLSGPNGAGKTTAWRVLAGLLRPHVGDVTWEGRPVQADDWPALRARLGFVGHDLMAQATLSGLENLAFFGRLYGVPNPRRTADEWLATVGLTQHTHEPLGGYSRGQRQRWALARAFQHRPAVVLLDEPFAGLDSDGAHLLVGLVEDHHRRGGASLLIGHDEPQLAALAARQLAMERGSLSGAAP